MRNGTGCVLNVLLLAAMTVPAGGAATAQTTFPVAAAAGASEQVALGDGALALMGPWRFRLGDDLQWAKPGFDDSTWDLYMLTGQGWSESLLSPQVANDPGWAGHGHRGAWGYGWYRVRIDLKGPPLPLTLLAPAVDNAYTVYWDGQDLGSDGDPTRQISYQGAYPESFVIPAPLSAPGEHVLAFRIWDSPGRAIENSPESGGLRGAPLLAESALATRLLLLEQRAKTVRQFNEFTFEMVPYFLVGAFSLVLYFFAPGRREYLWIGLALLFIILSDATTLLLPLFSERLLTNHLWFFFDVLTELFVLFSLLAAQWLLGFENRRWMRTASLVAGGGLFLAYGALVLNVSVLLSRPLDRVLEYAFLMLIVCLAVFLWMAIEGIRTLGAQAWLMLSPAMMTALLFVWAIVSQGRTSAKVTFVGNTVFQLLIPASVLLILAWRFVRQLREHQRLEGELQQAQAVQTLLVPEQLPQSPWYRVEGTYLPASQVGGDFYQVLPLPDGALMVVLGDVSGKGLQAAMVVSMTVGAVRAIVKQTVQPEEVLMRLNRELTGNLESGFVTCVCASVDTAGRAKVASAGHLPPLLNGTELEMTGSLPMGIVAATDYAAKTIHLKDGDTLTFMSDGIVEARRARDRELFGFERLKLLLSTQPGAAQIARMAQQFGQEDDISVLQITRLRIPA
jgi:hypothetical protein